MKRLRFLIGILFAVLISGCSSEPQIDSEYHMYYLNKNDTKILEQPYEPKADTSNTLAMIDEFVEVLQTDSGDVEYKKIIPTDVTIVDCSLEESSLHVYFDGGYSNLDKVKEALVRAATVRTLTQIKGVECVIFYVADAPLTDSNGNLIGAMTKDSFVENPGEQINSIQETVLVLYFSNEKGNGLIQEKQEVHYSSNISMEKLVMEHLLVGPKTENAKAAIPSGTKLVSVSVLDGVCYVSLDEGFVNHDYSVEEPIVIYSIVNSLSEIPGISQVQISVNGDTSRAYRDTFKLDELYERNLDYIDGQETTENE